jgi:endonuclease YncB( thermonuclease family)
VAYLAIILGILAMAHILSSLTFSNKTGCPSADKVLMTRRPPKTLGSALIAFLALLLASAALGQEAIVSARIVGMTDDDTIKALAEGYQLLRVRLSWIDAPENSQAFGQRSKQHLSELIFGREVELHTHGLDQYGRTLAVIFVNGMDANLEQVRSGMTWVYERYVIQAGPDIQVSYRQAETEAWQQQPDSGVNRTPFRRGNIGTLART